MMLVPTLMTFFLGLTGAALGWVALEFVGKPFRVFLDIKRECIEFLVLYGNVGPVPLEIIDDFRPRDPSIVEAESRLRSAREAFRKCGSRLHGFAKTETLAVLALRAIGFRPMDAALGFIGLSNSIGGYGEALHSNRNLIERSLKA